MNAAPSTEPVPTLAPGAEAAEAVIDEHLASTRRRSIWRRLLDSVSDPVLRILVLNTLVARLGRGVFLTLTVLYFTLIVGLSAVEVAIMLTASSAFGVASSAIAGQLSDRFSARRMVMWCMAVEAVALAGYVFAGSFSGALVVACVVGAADSAGNAARMSIVARAFEGPARVNARAVLRTVTNAAIAIGGVVGGIALLANTPMAFHIVMLGASVVFLASVPIIRALPARVDASPRTVTTETGTVRTITTSARSPWRDRRYLALASLSAVFGMQFGLAEIGVPLWVANNTAAPPAVVAALLIVNTVVVIVFTVPLARGTHDIRRAGTVTAWAGALMTAACLLYYAASTAGVILAVGVLVLAAIAHAFAEVLSQAGGWGLSFELADQAAPGAYQGVFSMGYNLGAMLAPIVITAALAFGLAGWIGLAVVFLLSALGTTAIAYRAAPRAQKA
jgi:MFS family permease